MAMYKVGVGDVVRVVRTGRLGTVTGMAEHTSLKHSVVMLDTGSSTPETASPADLEFVADSKIPANRRKWAWVVVLLAMTASFVASMPLWSEYHVSWPYLVVNQAFMYGAADRLFARLLLQPRKIRVR